MQQGDGKLRWTVHRAFKGFSPLDLFELALVIHTACSRHRIEVDEMYCVHWNEASGRDRTLIKGADGRTFEVIGGGPY